jgi:hypothetical protein
LSNVVMRKPHHPLGSERLGALHIGHRPSRQHGGNSGDGDVHLRHC